MAAELVRGQNHPLPGSRLEIRVSAGGPAVAGATLGDEAGRLREPGWIAHPGSPRLPGLEVSRQAAADHRIAVNLEALPKAVHRVSVLLVLPAGAGGPLSFGALAAPVVAVTGPDGAEVAGYTVTGLGAESAVVAVELYRRQGAWKVRAVGQGYAGGLAAMLEDQGLPRARETAAAVEEAVAPGAARAAAPPARTGGEGRGLPSAPAGGPSGAPGTAPETLPDTQPEAATALRPASAGPPAPPVPAASGPVDYHHPRRAPRATAGPPTSAESSAPAPPSVPSARSGTPDRPVAGDGPGWSMEERLYNQVWGMFEDLARTTAAYRGAVDFADSRMERELDEALADPRSRLGPGADAARARAGERRAELVDRARAALERDLAQLTAESEVVEPALPPAFARWDSPAWDVHRVPAQAPMAVRLGDLGLPEHSVLRIPMLVRLPLERGLWIDAGRTSSAASLTADPHRRRRLAGELATAVAGRLLAVHPAGGLTVHVLDPTGAAASALAPLTESGALREPPATGPQGVALVLAGLTRRVDLVQMAVRTRATDALPPDVDPAGQLLIVHDFPHGFDDRAVNRLRYLADEGPSAGVHLMMVADREEAREYGPVLDPLWRSLLRITPVPDDHLADPWVGHAWTYEPPLVPAGSPVLSRALGRVAEARRRHGR
ncbi:TerD family protein [Streptomyces chitinivorans]|uniref:TerD family protein n=1 Tax=Streptomyces chitinivorans TaxID=1257027 RepID=A0ABW7HPD7_9ACTN|nr:TerD family protein [Streptomyces chitinivorans]MDH2409264.1 TerD family protein [Streptomyces chitinivorans]